MKQPPSICPLEDAIRTTLRDCGIAFIEEENNPTRLDFYLPDYDVHIEVKGGHSERSGEQLSRAHNVILVQGVKSVRLLCLALKSGLTK